MKRAAVAALLVLATVGTAAAQPALTAPTAPPGYVMVPQDVEQKSEGAATMWAIGATAIGYLSLAASGRDDNAALGFLGTAGVLVGPSAGHIYAGENGHALRMSLLRTGALTAFAIGLLRVAVTPLDDCISTCNERDREWREYQRNGELLMLAGAATFVTSTIYDIIDASRAARRFNDKQKARAWQLAPSMARDAGGGVAPAFVVSGRW
ncbi:MAG: hypothetical protein KF773_40005 [Deltaproteobacteria bacterium]|nr:hypothetical protein [Deltaproteobacteria bacterium]MCW5807995.1 hypothetical protein [Deltaproteobacteria bacterium]